MTSSCMKLKMFLRRETSSRQVSPSTWPSHPLPKTPWPLAPTTGHPAPTDELNPLRELTCFHVHPDPREEVFSRLAQGRPSPCSSRPSWLCRRAAGGGSRPSLHPPPTPRAHCSFPSGPCMTLGGGLFTATHPRRLLGPLLAYAPPSFPGCTVFSSLASSCPSALGTTLRYLAESSAASS